MTQTINFHEGLRYQYNLTPDSLVIDVGAYHGNFSREISRLYGCKIWAFEPIRVWFDWAIKNQSDKVTVFPFGLGAAGGFREFYIKGDMSGEHAEGLCAIVSIAPVDILFAWSNVHLLKLNIEGGEFEVLETIIGKGKVGIFRDIQVQPHGVVPNAEARWAAIQSDLLKTHHLTYDFPWVWQNYRRNE